VMIEFTDPNPFKEFHIGHLYSNIVGESLARILEANGAIVWRGDYFGDVGMHVAKSLYGLQKKFAADKQDMVGLAKLPLEKRIAYLGQAYAQGASAFEEDTEAAEEIKKLNRLVYIAAQRMWEKEKGMKPQIDYRKDHAIDESLLDTVYQLYTVGREWSLAYFELIYKRLGTTFKAYFPESIAGERGYKLVKDHITDGVFVKSEGAIVFPGEKFDLHTRVFINSLGLPTYEAKELGLAPWKYEEFSYDLSLIVTGNEINAYFKVLVSAMKQINSELGEKTKHLGHGMVRLPEGKMSSRTGKIKTGESLLDEAKKRAGELATEGDGDIADIVGQAAIKYAFLKQSLGKDVIFNFDESISFEGNSGPYLQYTYVRTKSVLSKSGEVSVDSFETPEHLEVEERDLLRLFTKFSEIVEEAATRYAPSTLCTYLFEVAQAFNLFYQKHQILKADGQTKAFRLTLTRTTGQVLKQGLSLLGIQAPERM